MLLYLHVLRHVTYAFLYLLLFCQDANVFLSLSGALFDINSIELDKCLNHIDKFERGSEDVFEFRFPPLGDILSAKIMHDNSGMSNPVSVFCLCIVLHIHVSYI